MQDYSIQKTLGEGAFGKVYLVYSETSDVKYAVKTIDVRHGSKRDIAAAKEEGHILASLDHDNIVSYIETFESDGYLCFVTEYCSAGDLEKYLLHVLDPGDYIEESQIFAWTIEITSALQYLHSRKIVHRDIKTANIYLTDNLTVKVGDLGIAKVFDMTMGKTVTVAGAPLYMAPEIIDGKPYSYKVDIWGLGCCVYEMAALERLIQGRSIGDVILKVQKFKFSSVVLPQMYSKKLHNLLKGMLRKKPSIRLTADAVMEKLLTDIADDGPAETTEQLLKQNTDDVEDEVTSEMTEKEKQRNTLARKRRRKKISVSSSLDESDQTLTNQASTITRQASEEEIPNTVLKLPTRKSKNKIRENRKEPKEKEQNKTDEDSDLSGSVKSNPPEDELENTVLEQSSEKTVKKMGGANNLDMKLDKMEGVEGGIIHDEWENSKILHSIGKSNDKVKLPERERRHSKDKSKVSTNSDGQLKDSLPLYSDKRKIETDTKTGYKEYSQPVSQTVLEIDGICDRVFSNQREEPNAHAPLIDRMDYSGHLHSSHTKDSLSTHDIRAGISSGSASSSEILLDESADYSSPRSKSAASVDIYDSSDQSLPYSLNPQKPGNLSGSISPSSSQEGTLSQQNSFGKRLGNMEKVKFDKILTQFNSLMNLRSSGNDRFSIHKPRSEIKAKSVDENSEGVTLFTRAQTVSFKNNANEEEPVYENTSWYNKGDNSVDTCNQGSSVYQNEIIHTNPIGFERFGNYQYSYQSIDKNPVGFEGYGKVTGSNASRLYHLQSQCVQKMGEENFSVVFNLMSKTDDPKVLASMIKEQIGSQAYKESFHILQELRDLEMQLS